MITHVQFEAVCGPKFMSFCDDVDIYPVQFARTCPLMYIMLRSEDIGR